MTKIKVINTLKRYFNWAKLWQTLEINEEELDYYKLHWFELVQDNFTIKKNIVTENKETIANLKAKLDHLWVDYSKCKKIEDFEKLLQETENKKDEKIGDETFSISQIKDELIKNAIVDSLEWKKDEEIMQIAKDNWII